MEEEPRESTRTAPVGTEVFPLKPEEITVAWINEVLHNHSIPETDVVKSLKLEPTQEGYGRVGVVSRLKLNYVRPPSNAPQYLFAKFSSSGQREVSFYRDVAPRLQLRTPVCYFAQTSRAGNGTLLLENLSEGACGDAVNGCTPEQAEMVMIHAAELHGQCWNSPELLQWDWLQTRHRGLDVRALGETLRTKWWPAFREEYGSVIPEWATRIAVNAIDHLPDLFSKLAESPATLVHGDMQLDNVWFGHRDAPVILFDWQATVRSHAAEDISHFFADSYPTNQRRANEDGLLNAYLGRLRDFGVADYSLADLRESIAARMLWYLTTMALSAGKDFSNKRQAEQFQLSVRRTIAMWEDYPVGTVL